MKHDPKTAEDYIMPLDMNGLEGRMLSAPSNTPTRKREILLIYGHHAMLERWYGLVQNLQQYGNVTMPDLPGFGGMDSFYHIGKQPTLDNYADYLAAFVKMRYKRRRVTIVGISFGFLVATRMLQRYPELSKKVDLLVSIVGFMHYDDFVYKPRTRKFFSAASTFFSSRLIAAIIRYGFLNSYVIRQLYVRLPNGKKRFMEVDATTFEEQMAFETKLWQLNDVRTHWYTTSKFLRIDNCQKRIDLPVWHVASQTDAYFDNHIVKQHMLIVFNDYHEAIMSSKTHTPSIISDKKAMAVMLPRELRKVLSSKLAATK